MMQKTVYVKSMQNDNNVYQHWSKPLWMRLEVALSVTLVRSSVLVIVGKWCLFRYCVCYRVAVPDTHVWLPPWLWLLLPRGSVHLRTSLEFVFLVGNQNRWRCTFWFVWHALLVCRGVIDGACKSHRPSFLIWWLGRWIVLWCTVLNINPATVEIVACARYQLIHHAAVSVRLRHHSHVILLSDRDRIHDGFASSKVLCRVE